MRGVLAEAGPAERRVVTVLFADLAGYTSFCQGRDPEDVHLLVRPLMSTLRRECEAVGGVVPSIEGDGFMAVFGARDAAEDDPARAVEAAVRMQQLVTARQEVLPEIPGLHVGIHVGEVVVAWQDDVPHLSGDVVNVASRLAGLATAGQVLVSNACVPLTGYETGWSEPQELALRGRAGLVQARELDWQSVDTGGRAGRWAHDAPYVPRQELEKALVAGLEHGGVLLLGEAGAGKTRLAAETLAGRPVVRLTCSATRHPTAREVLALLLESLEEVPRDLVQVLRSSPGGAAERDGELAVVAAAGRRLGEDAAGAVVLLDDAEQLPDDELQDLAVAVAASGRPWVVVSRRALPALALPVVQVPDLSAQERDDLVDLLLPRASGELRDVLVRRAGASPLYLEQCARLLRESGAVHVDRTGTRLVARDKLRAVPTSMRLFVSSRLDLLSEDAREVISVAAVLGDAPDVDLLRHLTGDDGHHVEDLVERALLRWDREAARPVLRFTHALVRDVAYETMLFARRAFLHLAAADWYAVLPVSNVLEAQATHLEAAVVHGDPDCDLVRRAVEGMVLFARSVEEERPRVASDVLQRAQRLVEARRECDPDTIALDLCLASVRWLAGAESEAATAAERALGLAMQRGDARAAAEARLHLGRAHMQGDASLAEEHLALADQGFGSVGDLGGQARVALTRSFYGIWEGGIAQQVAQLERAYTLAMRSGDQRLQATAAQQLAMHHGFSTGREEFELWSERAVSVSRADDAGVQPRLDTARAALAFFELAPVKGRTAAMDALVAGRDLGLRHVYANAMIAVLDLAIIAGDLSLARSMLPEARTFAASRTSPWSGMQYDLLETRLLQREGDLPGARRLLASVAAQELAGTTLMRRDLAETRAWVALETGHFTEARAQAAEAVLVDEETGDLCPVLRPRLVDLVAAAASGARPALGEIAALKAVARRTGLTTVAELASRWLYVDEVARGWPVDVYGLEQVDTVEVRALDLEIEALSTGSWDLLEQAAAVWAELGTTVWQARALLWHSELTGAEHPEADRLLEVLQSPAGLGDQLRGQVRALKG